MHRKGDKTMTMKDIKSYVTGNKMFGISQAMEYEVFHREMIENDWYSVSNTNQTGKYIIMTYGDDYENTVYAVFKDYRLDHITLE